MVKLLLDPFTSHYISGDTDMHTKYCTIQLPLFEFDCLGVDFRKIFEP